MCIPFSFLGGFCSSCILAVAFDALSFFLVLSGCRALLPMLFSARWCKPRKNTNNLNVIEMTAPFRWMRVYRSVRESEKNLISLSLSLFLHDFAAGFSGLLKRGPVKNIVFLSLTPKKVSKLELGCCRPSSGGLHPDFCLSEPALPHPCHFSPPLQILRVILQCVRCISATGELPRSV